MKIKLSKKQWIQVIEQWLYGIQSGMTLQQHLQLLSKQTRNKKQQRLNQHCKNHIDQGYSLSHALNKIDCLQPSWLYNYIAAGETQGDLSVALQQLKSLLCQQCNIEDNIKKALFYPCAVLSLACIITLALLWFVIPQFQSIYQQLNVPLPHITKYLLSIAHNIKQHGMLTLAVTGSALATCYFCIQKVNFIRSTLHHWLLRIPLIRTVILMTNLSRWYQLLAMLMHAGIPLDQAATISSDSLSNISMRLSLKHIVLGLQKGLSLHQQLRNTSWLPHTDSELIMIGETSGQLVQVCRQLGQHYQKQLNSISSWVSQWLEPVIMLLLAVLIGGIVIAMYAPIFNLGNIL